MTDQFQNQVNTDKSVNSALPQDGKSSTPATLKNFNKQYTTQLKLVNIANNTLNQQGILPLQQMASEHANQHNTLQNITRSPLFNRPGVVQRFLDEDDRLPQADRVLNTLLANDLGYNDTNLFSQAAYDHLAQLHTTLVGLEDSFNEDLVDGPLMAQRAGMRAAYDAVYNYAQANYLEEGSDAWDNAATQGAIHIEQNDGATASDAAQVVWIGRAAHPQGFETAIDNVLEEREEARAQDIVAAYNAYSNLRLLPGTINDIKGDLGDGATLEQVTARLTTVYQRQCAPTRENWLGHLEIAGNAINGNAGLHFTTFNNSVPNPLNIRVDLRNRDEIMDDLFGAVETGRQLHATKVYENVSYHKYYNQTYIPEGGPNNDAALAQLDAEYNRMMAFMRQKVQQAIDRHGRIHHNNHAQQLNIGA